MRLVISDGPLGVSWQHASETCEFLGDAFALHHAKSGADYNEARHAIVYLVNELLENAIKFRVPGAIRVDCSLASGNFELTVSNDTAEDVALRFQSLIEEITSRDPGELLIERIEANAADETSSASGLGLLTLMNDYGARLGWDFRTSTSGAAVTLSTHAALTLN
ncbi:ATP-binding protein [Aestuariivirga litoralis]|uniref:ATP-binding protein n=2 Tax=Aestuariivirga litoralis TaxID=2650924 RepID=A0A2W2BHT0_9HYPH|nr:ATP-binding protein [Aestuariivirga litoralis]